MFVRKLRQSGSSPVSRYIRYGGGSRTGGRITSPFLQQGSKRPSVDVKCKALQAVQRAARGPRVCGGAEERREKKPKGRTIGGSTGRSTGGSTGGSSKIATDGSRTTRRRYGAGSSVDASVRVRRRRREAGRALGSSSCKEGRCLTRQRSYKLIKNASSQVNKLKYRPYRQGRSSGSRQLARERTLISPRTDYTLSRFVCPFYT
jgi:hypothetical protein